MATKTYLERTRQWVKRATPLGKDSLSCPLGSPASNMGGKGQQMEQDTAHPPCPDERDKGALQDQECIEGSTGKQN